MKKILGLVLVFIYFVTPVFAAEPISQEILDQAKVQAGLFMDLKNALGLKWLDEYNAYLANPTSSPEPSWASSVTELINENYLSTAFPTDFTITPTGQEVTISRIITSQGIKDALPIYLPAVTISGDTVSLLVQRPAQWVAWEDALASKVSRAGDDNPDILPGASLEFGSGSKIEFINNDGKLVGINSLTYKGQELEDRFVNAAGDNMTGPLKINGNIVWHAGNDGSGSGLDADLLDGQHGSFYRNASNLNAGIVPIARLSGTYNINISGRASIATNADYASNSDKLDGKDSSDFALSGHTHGYVSKKGDTMTGPLRFVDENTKIFEGSNNAVRIQTNSGYVDIGPQNTGWAHFSTDRPEFYFNKPVEAENMLKVYNTGTYLTGTEGKIAGNKILTTADEGHGKGIDADTIDGKHVSELGGGKFLRVIKYETPGTYTWTKGSETKYVKVLVWGGGASGGSSSVPGPAGGTSRFGSYVYAYGGSRNIGGSFSGVAGTRGRKGENGQRAGIGGLQVIQYEYENSSYAHGGNAYNSTSNLGGGAGGYATNIIDVTRITSVTVVVGKGGEINSLFQRSWKGNDGAVIVEEYTGPPMGY
jgi:hypothetical protein